jgi:hypothetical protein
MEDAIEVIREEGEEPRAMDETAAPRSNSVAVIVSQLEM